MPDSISVKGNVCYFCAGTKRRRFKNWKTPELAAQLQLADTDSYINEDRNNFHKSRAEEIVVIAEKGFSFSIHVRGMTDSGQNTAKLSLKQASERVDTFHIGAGLLYTRAAFIFEYKMDPEAAGYSEQRFPQLGGGALVGYKVKDHGRRPLPAGVIPFSSDSEGVACSGADGAPGLGGGSHRRKLALRR